MSYNLDDGFISVPGCEIDSTVSEGTKVIQNKAKASNWELILRERGSHKFFQLHPLPILMGYFICSWCLFVFLLPQ